MEWVRKNIILFDEQLVLKLLVFRTQPDVPERPNKLLFNYYFFNTKT